MSEAKVWAKVATLRCVKALKKRRIEEAPTLSNDALQELIAEVRVIMNYVILAHKDGDTVPLTESTVKV